MSQLSLVGDQLTLSLNGHPDFRGALEEVKQVTGRRWDPDARLWVFPAEPIIAERLIVSVKPEVGKDVLDWIRDAKRESQKELVTPLPEKANLVIPWAEKRAPWQPEEMGGNPFTGLKDYQRVGVQVMADRGRSLLADEPGLGKTAQTIATVAEVALRHAYECHVISGKGGVKSCPPSEELLDFLRRVNHPNKLKTDEDLDEAVLGFWNIASSDVPGHVPEKVHVWEVDDRTNRRGLEFSLDPKYAGRTLHKDEKPYKRTKIRGSIPSVSAHAALSALPKLIVCPNSVKGVWHREIRMWLGEDQHVVAVEGAAKARKKQITEAIEANGWIIVNWEQLRVKKVKKKKRYKVVNRATGEFVRYQEKTETVVEMVEPLFGTTPWMVVAADEVHRAKNRKALSSQGLYKARGGVMIGATGTPVLNSPDELWSPLHWLYPEQYGSSSPGSKTKDPVLRTPYWSFYDRYVDHYEGQFGKVITGVKNPDSLRFELRDRLIRRTKGEVLDLPEKVRQYIPVKMTKEQAKLYKEAEAQMWFEVEQAIKAGDPDAMKFAESVAKGENLYQIVNGAARTVRLRQILSSPALLGGEDSSGKLDTAQDIILDAGSQFVVFSEFVGTTKILCERLEAKGLRAVSYTGEVSSVDRTSIEDTFQDGGIDVVVGTIGAMREGITLTAASDEIFLERAWTPAYNEQAEDRCYRIGQKNNVTVRILEGEGSVDTQKVRPTNAIKNMIVESIITKDDVKETHEN